MTSPLSKDLKPDDLKLLAEAVDCSVSPFAIYGNEFELIYANQTARDNWPKLMTELENGASIEDAIDLMCTHLLPDGDMKSHKAATDYAYSTLSNPEPTTMLGARDRWFEMTHHRIGDRATAGVGVEITKLKQQEIELRKARALQKQTFNALSQGLVITSTDGTIVQFNRAYKEYVEASGGTIKVGMNMKERVRQAQISFDISDEEELFEDWYSQTFWKRFNREDVVHEEEYSMKDGRHYLWRQNYDPMVGNIVTITDITDVKNAQIKAKEAERAKSEFLANMSHEIRTPMNGVLGMAQLLKNCDLGPKEQNFVQTIQRSGEALITIINDILDFSKIEAGHIVLDNSPFALNHTIEDVALLLSSTAAEKQIDLFVDIQPNLPKSFLGDEGRFRQILLNLMGNAVKFTHEGHVAVTVTGKTVEGVSDLTLAISDTGIGIPKEQVAHVFDKFRQVDGTHTRKYEGTGLGLSIASQLIGLMGGEISVESTIGKGTTFTIRVSLSESKYNQEEDSILNNLVLNGANILIIDPNALKQTALKTQFSHWKSRPIAVDSLHKAVAVLQAARLKNISIDLVIISEKSYFEAIDSVLVECKNNKGNKDIPTLILSPVGQDDFLESLKNKGVDAALTYPLRNDFLLNNAVTLLTKDSLAKKALSVDLLPVEAHTKRRGKTSPVHTPSTPENAVTYEVKDSLDILVAEDNEVNKMYVDYILKESGLTYKIVSDGQEALEAFKVDRPRAILMDISMPNMNGYEATQAIRNFESENNLDRTPIIAATAHAMSGDRDKCLAADMDDYISKPIAMERLQDIFERWGLNATKNVQIQQVS